MSTATPFTINIPQERLDRIMGRVADYEWHEMPANGGWAYGTNMPYLQELCTYWQNDYDWRAVEKELNRFNHFTAPVEANGEVLDIHFIHEKGSGSNPRPLIITHGWPGSFVEFMDVIEPLAHPERFGGREEDAFDVIVPSLPGYGFSGKPANPIGPRITAEYWNTLMVDVLGYDSYFAQGGDWGSAVTSNLGRHHGQNCKGIHLNMMAFRPGTQHPPETEEDQQWLDTGKMVFEMEGAYFRLQMTKPQTLSYGMMDSPVGQAAWILEKFNTWSETQGDDVESAYTKEQLLTNIMIYCVTRSFNTAAWMYRGMIEEGGGSFSDNERVETPTGVGNFPGDVLAKWPRRAWSEKVYNIVHWTDIPKGGHFAAMEQPELFIEDVRKCFGEMGL
ncbi:MAG: epoxide hydrolase family protein [Alphaproteobacteria bacterium]